MDEHFQSLAQWLLYGLIDFDYISESLLPQQCEAGNAPLSVGEMAYDVVLVPDCQTPARHHRGSAGEFCCGGRPAGFRRAHSGAGGREAEQPRQRAGAARGVYLLFPKGRSFPRWTACAVDIRDDKGCARRICCIRFVREGDTRYVFLCHGEKPENPDVCPREDIVLRIREEWKLRRMDTATGEIAPLHVAYEKGRTVLRYAFYAYDSLLIELTPGRAEAGEYAPAEKKFDYYALWHPVEIALNLNPMCCCSIPRSMPLTTRKTGAMRKSLLRADDAFREELGYPLRKKEVAQPWVVPDEPITHHLRLKFTVHSEMEIKEPQLALKKAESVEIAVNGCPVDSASVGWFVDESIKSVQLPDLPAGGQCDRAYPALRQAPNVSGVICWRFRRARAGSGKDRHPAGAQARLRRLDHAGTSVLLRKRHL